MNTNKELLFRPIVDEVSAIAYIRMLVTEGLAYHFDDSASTVIDAKSGRRIFDDQEATAADERAEELSGISFTEYEGEFGCMIGLMREEGLWDF